MRRRTTTTIWTGAPSASRGKATTTTITGNGARGGPAAGRGPRRRRAAAVARAILFLPPPPPPPAPYVTHINTSPQLSLDPSVDPHISNNGPPRQGFVRGGRAPRCPQGRRSPGRAPRPAVSVCLFAARARTIRRSRRSAQVLAASIYELGVAGSRCGARDSRRWGGRGCSLPSLSLCGSFLIARAVERAAALLPLGIRGCSPSAPAPVLRGRGPAALAFARRALTPNRPIEKKKTPTHTPQLGQGAAAARRPPRVVGRHARRARRGRAARRRGRVHRRRRPDHDRRHADGEFSFFLFVGGGEESGGGGVVCPVYIAVGSPRSSSPPPSPPQQQQQQQQHRRQTTTPGPRARLRAAARRVARRGGQALSFLGFFLWCFFWGGRRRPRRGLLFGFSGGGGRGKRGDEESNPMGRCVVSLSPRPSSRAPRNHQSLRLGCARARV